MNKTITLIGLLEKKFGKTFFIKNHINLLTNKRIIIPFRPMSCANYWYHPENTRYVIKTVFSIHFDSELKNWKKLFLKSWIFKK